MKPIKPIVLITLLFISSGISDEYEANWPAWRGPLCTGEAPHGNPPTDWSETKNVKWKVPVPGKGLSTPVIWDNLLFITTAVELDSQATAEKIAALEKTHPMWMKLARVSSTTDRILQFTVMAFDRKSGKTVWRKIVNEDFPHEGTHRDGSWASQSCVTDGEVLIAFFGSYGLYCMNLKGDLIWEKDLGDLKTRNAFGEGSSPALYKDRIVVNWDHEGDSFITVLDKTTGKEIWKKPRNERTSWATPIVVEVNGRAQIVIPATNNSVGYDLETGETIWMLSGMTANVIPSPMASEGIVYMISGFRGSAAQAVDLTKAKGNLEGTDAVIWTHEGGTPYTPSGLLYQDRLYFPDGNREKLSCLNAGDGTVLYAEEKLNGLKGVYASPVAAAGRIYIVGRNGATAVITSGNLPEVIAVNTLEDGFDASPAIVGNALYLRGLKNLYCLSE